MKDLLLVIDMQKVYEEGGAWACPGSGAAAVQIRHLLSAKPAGMQTIFTRFLASEDPPGVWAQYNVENAAVNADPVANAMMDAFPVEACTKEANAAGRGLAANGYGNADACIRIEKDLYPLYTKSTYSSLTIPEVRAAAREAAKNGARVLVSGVVAECCVLATVMNLIDAGCKVIYLTDAVAGISPETEAAVELVLSGLEPLHVERMTVDKYVRSFEEEKGETL